MFTSCQATALANVSRAEALATAHSGRFSRAALLLAAALSALVLPGCAAGVVGVLAGALALSGGGGGAGRNAAPVIADLTSPTDTRRSPLRLTFRLVDDESDPADLAFVLADVGVNAALAGDCLQAPEEPRARSGDPVLLFDDENLNSPAVLRDRPTSRDGVPVVVYWDYAQQLGATRRRQGLRLELRVIDGPAEPQQLTVAVGNDAPCVVAAQFPDGEEASGVVPVTFTVAESSPEPFDVRVEFVVPTGPGGGTLELARPGGLVGATPRFQLPGQTAPSDGRRLVFFWDSAFDLAGRDVAVILLISAFDGIASSTPSAVSLRVDNNREPTAFLDVASLVGSTDRRRAVPVPFRVQDPEGNDVEVLVQWRLANEAGFPPLSGLRPEEIRALAADPVERRRLRIATERQLAVGGRIGVAGLDAGREACQARLPEIGTAGFAPRPADLEGQELLVLRVERAPRLLELASGLLDGPVAALPLDDGIGVLVLDRDPSAGFRLRVLDLAGRELVAAAGTASGPGSPAAMALDPLGRSVVVATESGNLTRLFRVDLPASPAQALGEPRPLATTSSIEPLRGLACLGTEAAVGIGASTLVRFRYQEPPLESAQTVVGGLSDARDIAVDPVLPGRVFVAERAGGSGGRVAIFDVESRVLCGAFAVPRPEAIAFASPERLLVVTDAGGDGLRELRVLSPASGAVETLATGYAGEVAALAAGAEGLVVLALSGLGDLAAGGGIVQRRRIDTFSRGIASVPPDAPFVPPLRGGEPWRVLLTRGPRPAPLDGVRGRFLWDTAADLPGGGEVSLRILPLDAEQGLGQELDGVIALRGELDAAPEILGGGADPDAPPGAPGSFTAGAAEVIAADIDGDGDLDLAAACHLSGTVEVYLEDSAGRFGRAVQSAAPDPQLPSIVLRAGGAGAEPYSLAAADFDRDGRIDLVAANRGAGTLAVFLQLPFAFVEEPPTAPTVTLAGLSRPVKVVAADLNGDGRVDLAVANEMGTADSGNLTVFLQPEIGFSGGQRPAVVLQPATDFADPKALAVADLSGDGLPDIVSANDDSENLSVFLQTPSAAGEIAFSEPRSFRDSSFQSMRSLVAADVDGDGLADVVAGSYGRQVVAILRQCAAGELVVAARLSVPLGLRPLSLAAADFNADGLLDLAAACEPSGGPEGGVAVFYQRPRGPPGNVDCDAAAAAGFADGQVPDLVLSGLRVPQAACAAVLDAAGFPALVVAERALGRVVLYRPRSGPTLGVPLRGESGESSLPSVTLASLGAAGTLVEARAVAAADLNADGILDLAAADSPGNVRALFLQRNPARFEESADGVIGAAAGGGSEPVAIAAADIDGDGLVDLASANRISQSLALFRQGPPGSFGVSDSSKPGANGVRTLAAPPSVMDTPQDLVLADLDGDGRCDVASANRRSASITVFLQPPAGFFSSAAEPALLVLSGCESLPGPTTLAAADVDGDGRADLVAANGQGQRSSITLLFQGEGGFPPSGCPSRRSVLDGGIATLQPRSVAAADLDGDGRADIVSANAADTLAVFLQPAGGFPPGNVSLPPVLIREPRSLDLPVSLALGDFDADGRLDLATANLGTRSFTVFLQRRGGLAPDRLSVLVAGGVPEFLPEALDVAAADVDGDGDLDLVGSGVGALWVFWGSH